MTGYAELQITSNFSFLRGASHPEELVGGRRCARPAAFAVTDRNTLAGVVRATGGERDRHPLLVGCRLDLRDGAEPAVLSDRPRRLWPSVPAADGRQAPRGKGEVPSHYADVVAHGEGQLLVAVPPEEGRLDAAFGDFSRACRRFRRRMPISRRSISIAATMPSG